MSLYTGTYVGAKGDSRGPQPGSRQLAAWFLAKFASVGGRNDGIYNYRPVRGGTTLSLHCEGRAVDLGNPAGVAWQQDLANWLVANSRELGVQCAIFNHHIWSCTYYNQGWRAYHGVDGHTTHIHTELTWAAAKSLTSLNVEKLWVATHRPVVPPDMSLVGRVKSLQNLLEVTVDGVWGDITDKRAGEMRNASMVQTYAGRMKFDIVDVQKVIDATADGVWGPKSQASLVGWVKLAQYRVLGVSADGVWGPNCESAYWTLRKQAMAV